MASLKSLRERYQEKVEKAANLAKTANSQSRISQISHFSRVFEFEDEAELQFLRDERAAVREYDAGMQRNRAEYLECVGCPEFTF